MDELTLEVTLKPIKGIYLRVLPPEGAIKVSAPIGIRESDLVAFIRHNRDKINKALEKVRETKVQPPLEYKSGERVPLLGKLYSLQVIENETKGCCKVDNNSLILNAPKGASKEKKEAILYAFYRRVLNDLILQYSAKWERIWGVEMSGFTFRRQKTIWGSCNRRTKRISYNLELAKYPKECIEYIVAHELLHIIFGGHGRDFKNALSRELPHWRQLNNRLKDPPATDAN